MFWLTMRKICTRKMQNMHQFNGIDNVRVFPKSVLETVSETSVFGRLKNASNSDAKYKTPNAIAE
jgi:hypothetical protein